MKISVLFKALFFLSALHIFSAAVFADSATDTPKLNLQVRKIAQYPNLSGWRFDVRNNDSKQINVSDLEIRFWVFEPNKKLIGKFYRNSGWVDAYGIVNGEAVMCAFLSPSYETIGNRKADYAIRYRTSKDYWIQPGETWKNVRFGYGSADIDETTSYSQMPMQQKGDASEGFFFSSTYDDPHFCLYYRGKLVQEWLSSSKVDPDSGVEPEPYRTTGKPSAIVHDAQPAQPSDSINPMYSNLPELSEPLRIGDQSKVIMQNGQMINVAQAKMEVQAYMQNHPGQTTFARPMAGNPNIHYASLQSQPTNGVAFNYDADGNVITDPSGRTFTYDSLDRMIGATGPSLAVSYVYDGDGLRVKKVNSITGIETDYLWDTNNITGVPQVVEEHQNGQVICVYTYGPEGLISMDQLVNGSWVLHYFGKDGQGNVRDLEDQNGNVTDTFTYDAFGNLLSQTGSTQNNMLYAGEYFDSDVQLYYLRSRWMSPSIGRFYSMDSYEGQREDPLSLHKYVYVGNNPLNKMDPSGKDAIDEEPHVLWQNFNIPGQATYVFLGENVVGDVAVKAKQFWISNNGAGNAIANNVVHTYLVKTSNPKFTGIEPGEYVEAYPTNYPDGKLHSDDHIVTQTTNRLLPSAQELSPLPLYFNSNSLWSQIQSQASKYKQDSVDYDYWAWNGANSNSFTGTIVRNIGLPITPTRNAWGWGKQLW